MPFLVAFCSVRAPLGTLGMLARRCGGDHSSSVSSVPLAPTASRRCRKTNLLGRFFGVLVTPLCLTLACSRPTPTNVERSLSAPSHNPARAADAQPARPMDAADARHLLGRFTFGVTADSLRQATSVSVERWLDLQLQIAAQENSRASMALAPFRTVLAPPEQLWSMFGRKGERKREIVDDQRDVGALLQQVQAVQLVRQIGDDRQLLEVMTDFWFNHFNVDGRKTRLTIGDYVEHAIRPHALGRFEDLLIATSRHPAMLVYLDNNRSVAPPRNPNAPSTRAKTGITENYARELLELHTLGVDGGYTQQDVIETARVLTGWTTGSFKSGNHGFRFVPKAHDYGSKVILGARYPAGQGEQEGVRLLKALATHPATARRISHKLCVRFVADTPPATCTNRLAKVFRETRGDIRAMLRSLVTSGEFWDIANRGAKLKTPHEFMVSALRSLNAQPTQAQALSRWSSVLGQPILLEPSPTGYPNESVAWLSTAGLAARMNFAMALASNHLGGVRFDVPTLTQAKTDEELIARVNASVLGGAGTQQTLTAIGARIAEVSTTEHKREVALAMALASPEFQKK